jgi:hypothetical protein
VVSPFANELLASGLVLLVEGAVALLSSAFDEFTFVIHATTFHSLNRTVGDLPPFSVDHSQPGKQPVIRGKASFLEAKWLLSSAPDQPSRTSFEES